MVDSLATEPARGESDSLTSDGLTRGTRLGRYELLVPVAVGGMARVWAARLQGQLGFSKLVAIKTVLPHLAGDPEFSHMLADEAKIASGTRHPNVVEIYELGEENEIFYVAMEWVYGDSLSQIFRANGGSSGLTLPLEARIAARIAADAAAGLHAAHEMTDDDGRALHVVHRDVSPHNVLVSLDGNVKVTDFGVAKLVGAMHQPTSAGQLKGKVAYMAPEQADGAPVDRRSDVFSLGCVLYEATTGQRPFRGDGDHQVMQELLKGSFLPPSQVARNYPVDLERIVVRAMSRKPILRYQSMDQMRLALEEWLAKGGAVVTQSHVARVVRERIGAEVEKRRERIRLASSDGSVPRASVPPGPGAIRTSEPPVLRRTDPPPSYAVTTARTTYAPPPSALATPAEAARPATLPSSFPPVIDASPRVPSKTDYLMAGSLGVIAAAALGASGFWVWSSMQSNAANLAAATPGATVAAVASADPTLVPVPPPTGTAALLAPPVTFRVVPETATLVANGSPLPAGERAVPRPLAGALQNVTVHADGFEDQTVTLDESSPTFVDVWLDEKANAARPAGDAARHESERAPTGGR